MDWNQNRTKWTKGWQCLAVCPTGNENSWTLTFHSGKHWQLWTRVIRSALYIECMIFRRQYIHKTQYINTLALVLFVYIAIQLHAFHRRLYILLVFQSVFLSYIFTACANPKTFPIFTNIYSDKHIIFVRCSRHFFPIVSMSFLWEKDLGKLIERKRKHKKIQREYTYKTRRWKRKSV